MERVTQRRGEGHRADLLGASTLGRAGGAMFVAGSIAGLVVGVLVLGRWDWLLVAYGLLGVMVGVAVLRVRWLYESPASLLAQSLLAFMLIAAVTRVLPELLVPYLPLYVLVFVAVGATQHPLSLPLASVVATLAFIGAAWGIDDHQVYEAFALTLAVGVISGGVLAVVTDQRRLTALALERLFDDVAGLPRAEDAAGTAALLERAVLDFVDADYVISFLEKEPGADVYRAVTSGATGQYGDESVDIHTELLTQGDFVFVPDARTDPRTDGEHIADAEIGSVAFIPLYGSRSLIGGTVVVWRRVVDEPAPSAQFALRILTTEAGLIFERQQAAHRLSVEATTDGLTGLLNRRAVDRRLGRLRPGDAVVLIDLDDFKGVNDSAGHVVGDRTLRQLARVMVDSCRAEDWCGRLGGDEFVVVLRGGGAEGLRAVLDKMRAAWDGEFPPTSFSAGGAVHIEGEDPLGTVARADAALYRAKDAGRDRTEIDEAV